MPLLLLFALFLEHEYTASEIEIGRHQNGKQLHVLPRSGGVTLPLPCVFFRNAFGRLF